MRPNVQEPNSGGTTVDTVTVVLAYPLVSAALTLRESNNYQSCCAGSREYPLCQNA